ncbi:MAG: hypothetical protein A2150_01595 [Candidatus Muproteobacteria bacterium RBG_16_64_11]|uniref:Uncharacterized protein n=1 Tax=Candidatus Muproteobacteria bacterium RBG_16_64_11 TaxID=1817758 RepID=A0A1F6THY1_9PROT|nr:MAG: hypothetical protein A2150_01595 [Candidatus Muproteobacteria bacterium RBG_16_64_11]
MFGDECSRYESRANSARYNTLYLPAPKPADTRLDPRAKPERPLPKGVVAQVAVYKMAFDGDKIKPCSDLSIRKEIVLQRIAQPDLVLREIREFYAQDGTLIATNAEDISTQLATSGVYQAATPLPIPRSAPPGKYRIVSRLLVETGTMKKPAQLAKVEGVFQVIPPAP